jgi:Nif-specific regulatory protein
MRRAISADGGVVDIDRLQGQSAWLAMAAKFYCRAHRVDDPDAYLAGSLEMFAAAGADYIALATASAGHWLATGESGGRQPLPADLLAEALDREALSARGDWVVVPLETRHAVAEMLVLHGADLAQSPATLTAVRHLGAALFEGLAAVRSRALARRRVGRLEAMLEMSSRWNATREVQPLLTQMAEAATRLFRADRASIFLWDRANHILVGRPALGVKDNELRIPDDRGVVGRVIQTGQPYRADASLADGLIDHQVDSQLGYRTRTLLCVPLRGASGELFGAFELINKIEGNFTDEDQEALAELSSLAAIALENAQDRQDLLSINRRIVEEAAQRVRLIGESPAIVALRSVIRRVADTDLAVLILGENGTGKEIVAQSIHYGSRRAQRPFVAINCAAIPENLAESELFGHEKGAFTDAREARAGKFELAAGGTLFLDEIGDLSLAGQSKLLRVLEEKVLTRVGGSLPIHTDARVIAATNQSLADMVGQRRFREDLYFRLNVVTLDVPPLRERREDIMRLAQHFLNDFCKKARRRVPQFAAAAQKRLESHLWPGNVRELRNLMERLAYLSSEDRVQVEDLAFALSPRGESPLLGDLDQPLSSATDQFQIECIRQSIKRAGGNMSEAAQQLGLHRSNLYRKMRQLGISVPP